jgi:hypothetical protein
MTDEQRNQILEAQVNHLVEINKVLTSKVVEEIDGNMVSDEIINRAEQVRKNAETIDFLMLSIPVEEEKPHPQVSADGGEVADHQTFWQFVRQIARQEVDVALTGPGIDIPSLVKAGRLSSHAE